MSVDTGGSTDDVIEDYRAKASGGVDELVTSDGVRDLGLGVAQALLSLGADGLADRAQRVRSFIADEGISYGTRHRGGTTPGWSLDPIPLLLSADEWDRLESGLAQRAILLDAVLGDIYGERRLVRRGLLPAETFLGHSGFLHQAASIRLPGPRQLVLAATDLARDAQGAWRVLGDRAQAPSGAAYAMANRRIIARVLPTLHRRTDLARLRGFFDTMRQAVQASAPPGADAPRVVVLSPGPLSETAYDQALTATLLGFPLVEADDLTARDGQVWLRTTGGLERVDVLVRRVDADWCDNLELRPESRLGVPGLVEAARVGSCSVVNPLGAAVLENVALLPYLNAVCRAVTGSDLELAPATTWWCGDPSQRSHVLAHLDRLVLKATSRGVGPASRFGWELDAAERDEMAARIRAQPWAWAGQEPLAMSTAPVVTPDGLAPRRLVLRTFGVADGDGYCFLPGGLARVALRPDTAMITSVTGAPSKDVWVLADRDAERRAPTSARLRVRRDAEALGAPFTHEAADLDAIHEVAGLGSITPRVAEDFYWLGRYLERVEGTSRLLRVAVDLDEDHGLRPGTPGATTLDILLRALAAVSTVRFGQADAPDAAPGERTQRYLNTVLFDDSVHGTVGYAARRAIGTARGMREQMSQDVWIVLSRLETALLEKALSERSPARSNAHLQRVIADTLQFTLAVAGIQHESLVRGPEWAFFDAGRRIERAQHTVRMLRHTVAVDRPPVIDAQVTEAILVAGESVITYRRRTAAGHGPSVPFLAAADLLLLDGGNPRSVRHAMDRLGEDLAVLPAERVGVDAVLDHLEAVDPDDLGGDDRVALAALLEALGFSLRGLSETITARYFVHQAPQRSLPWQFDLARPAHPGAST